MPYDPMIAELTSASSFNNKVCVSYEAKALAVSFDFWLCGFSWRMRTGLTASDLHQSNQHHCSSPTLSGSLWSQWQRRERCRQTSPPLMGMCLGHSIRSSTFTSVFCRRVWRILSTTSRLQWFCWSAIMSNPTGPLMNGMLWHINRECPAPWEFAPKSKTMGVYQQKLLHNVGLLQVVQKPWSIYG